MHRAAFIVSKVSLVFFFLLASVKVSRHFHNTRAVIRKRMDSLEQENQTPREKMTSMRAEMEKMTTLLSAMTVAQTQTSAPQLTNTSRVQTVSSDMPHNYIEGFHFSTSGPHNMPHNSYYVGSSANNDSSNSCGSHCSPCK